MRSRKSEDYSGSFLRRPDRLGEGSANILHPIACFAVVVVSERDRSTNERSGLKD